ncbi:FtsX-like permease family protein [Acetobacterium malicum]|uniref:FtsX-like permease family protein n=1 Tax=Acetobacterium malicum TaxID=52692 RepID=A0ABR6YZ51_9FIRM|nr:ABC transporter permease [Acetobacterium malicum]MBC3900381.1 FtsX-like permease family protein [Acetobacterium malicum]
MILNKRIIRELKENWVRYGALAFLIIFSLGLVVSMAGSTDVVNYTIDKNNEKNQLEDGEFSVYVPLTENQQQELEKMGARTEAAFYVDLSGPEKSVLRIFKNRNSINTIELEEGRLADQRGEIVLEKHYAEKHGIRVGQSIEVNQKNYLVTGIGTVPDYSNVVQNVSDVLADLKQFSIGFVSESEFNQLLAEDINVEYNYSYKLDGNLTASELKEKLVDLDFDKTKVANFNEQNMDYQYVNLITFLEAGDNQRITSCKSDAAINKNSALIAGVIILTLIAYMISVFVIHTIDKESAVIGALYSMGYVKKELLRHFMILPMLVVTASAMLGTGLGFLLIGENIKENVAYYSYPGYTMVFPPYLLIYGVLIPVLIALVVNYTVINSKLSLAPLKLLRREKKQLQLASVDLKEMGFINRYRIRQLLREIRGNITLFWGLSIAILLMVFGFSIYGSISAYVNNVASDVEYNYLYLLKYPMETAPNDVTKAYTESLAADLYLTGGEMDVTVQGIDDQNPYFDFPLDGEKNEVVISDSVANKFGYKVGDEITLSDNLEDRNYNFTVKEVVNFASGLYIFMDIKDMRELFGQEEDYYNTLMSDQELDIEAGRIATVITVDKMVAAARQMFAMMYGLVITILGASVLLFAIVMYLLVKMMIDKSAFSISLIKVFGYNEREIKKLYLGTTFYTVALTTLIAIPASKMIINKIYPYMVSNVSAGMNATMSPQSYLIMVAVILSAYAIVNFMVGRHLKKISLAEILKERE